ncbi:LytS/YhcK type 5TM receptor domain-containing protein, partial [Chloroflexota bacterium]
NSVVARNLNTRTQIILIIIFGALALYGTYSGVKTTGAIANIRNLGPMVAGLLGGPWVGLGAGLIGGVHRYFLGGFTAVPCAIGTVLSGLAAGIFYAVLKGNIGVWKPILLAFIIEVMDMALILLIARTFSDAVDLVKIIAMPMILGDTIGVAVFAYMLSNMFSDRKANGLL